MSAVPDPVPQQGLIVRMADRYGLEPAKFMQTIKATAFRTAPDRPPVTNEQLAALLLVAERHRLDPFTKEIYAYPDKGGGIVPVVGIDGWLRIINEHPQFDGMETTWDNAEASMTCTIWRKDRTHPTVVTEYLAECRRNTEPWKMTHRMMRHKATMQCGRYAFGFAGIHDEDEAQDIMRGMVPRGVQAAERVVSNADRFREAMQQRPGPIEAVQEVTDVEPVATPEHATEPEPPTLVGFIQQMGRAVDSFAGEMILEEARELLDEADMRELHQEFVAKFPDPDEGETP